LTPDEAPDRNIRSEIDFAAEGHVDFAPGLYLIAASDADAKPVKDEPDKDSGLTPTAAAWLLRSGLRLGALRDGKTYIALAETSDASAVKKDVRVIAMDRNLQIVGEASSDANGQALLTPKQDKNNEAQTLIGLAANGDVAFLDLSHDVAESPALPPISASIAVDQAFYAPAATIGIALAARDIHKHPVSLTDSVLQLLRPDRSFYDSRPVTLDPNGAARLALPAPVPGGAWHLVWRQADGQVLAETSLRVSANPTAPELTIAADRGMLTGDGGVNLTIRSQTAAKTPVPFVTGHIELAWAASGRAFPGWQDYDFDDGRQIDETAKPVAFFITDANGAAHAHVDAPPPDHAPSLREARLSVLGDPALDVLNPEPLILPVKPAAIVLGVKPFAENGRFSENSRAHFDIAALDGDGQRRALDDLTYQIYEEGRSFEWRQFNGRWDYKQQQQQRRIGGGRLSLTADGDAAIEWPVTSGAYRLEITNADGNLLARENFSAGWGFPESGKSETAPLDLKPAAALFQIGKEEKIGFTMARPGLVTATIADDRIRAVIHASYPAGANFIAFTPAADWGNRVKIRADVRYDTGDESGYQASGSALLTSAVETVPAPPRVTAKTKDSVKIKDASIDLVLRDITHQLIEPRQSWSASASKLHALSGSHVAFLGPEPFFDLPAFLSAVLNQHPFATEDLARQLDIFRLWRDAIGASLMQESDLRSRQNDLLMRLLARQRGDGGFAPIPNGGASDIVSTAAAVETLGPLGDDALNPVIGQATGWLLRRLENTWFDEKERPERAAAYAALAAAGKLDLASLHYFSDTSADKSLPPLAAVELAYAFASTGDKDASSFWIGKARGDGSAGFAPATLPILLANAFFAPGEALASLEKASKLAREAPDDFGPSGDFLRALWRYEDRSGVWRAGFGKDEKNLRGVFAFPLAERNPPVVHNPSSDKPLHLATATAAKSPPVRSAIMRHIYRLDGGEMTGRLTPGAVYLIVLEGPWAGEGASTLAVHENPAPAFLPLGCAIEAPSADSFLGWLAYKTPTPAKACEKSGDGLDILLPRGENDAASWRIAYLASANGVDLRSVRPAAAQVSLQSR
jgi:hypothetical protein